MGYTSVGCIEDSLTRIDRYPKTTESTGNIQKPGLLFQRLGDGEGKYMIYFLILSNGIIACKC